MFSWRSSWILILLLLHPHPHLGQGQSEEEVDNAIRAHHNGNLVTNRNTPPSPIDSSIEGNVSALVTSVDGGCAALCQDQIQYNAVCINKGCAEWKSALREGCFSTCNGVISSYRENYACQLGCSRALEDYVARASNLLTPIVTPPTLISSSLQSSSLRLNWDGSTLRTLSYVAYSLQKKSLEGGAETSFWETVPGSPTNATNFAVHNLRPYSNYQFRVGWILASDFAPVYSRESYTIQTEAKGLPSAPSVTSVQPISNSSVAVTWSPPTSPNGRLVAYRLRLRPLGGLAVIKELPASANPKGYTFSGLAPATNYSLAVFAVNWEGEGEPGQVSFVTPTQSGDGGEERSKSPEARLIVQSSKKVYSQPLDLLLEPEPPFFTSTHNLTATALHVKHGWAFVSTTEGEVYRVNLGSGGQNSSLILTKERLDLSVVALSVDWLHDKLYIVGKKKRTSPHWTVKRCDLDGAALTTVYSKIPTKPLHFAADPFTGYLYWVTPASHAIGGLFKLDLLAESGSSAIAVLEDNDLGPFALDVANYRIFIIHRLRNKVLSVSLDGDVSNIRENTQSPQWSSAVSLVLYNGVLYWTTPTSVVSEEYNSAANVYYQNSFDVPKSSQPLGNLVLLHPDAQPTPIPMAAPTQVQVLYGQTRARVTWSPPPPISALGDGAWAGWLYTLRLSDNRSFTNISGCEVTLPDLRPSTFYSVQVAAYSAGGGRGRWSLPSRGKTLARSAHNISLLWGSGQGLYATDTLGEELTLLTGGDWGVGRKGGSKQIQPSPNTVASLTWWESTVFYALSNGSVFVYGGREELNKSPHFKSDLAGGVSLIPGISYAQSIAWDYIGLRLYWSNPRAQTIYRCALTWAGNSNSNASTTSTCTPEPLQVVTMAREIVVDSYKGLLLWSTGHSIEMSRLNGYAHGVLHQNGLFSGKQIMGMTLDTEQSRIYWVTRSGSASSLQRLQYNIRGAQMPMIIAQFEDTAITGPIRYFNERLLWLQGSSEAVITDLYGQSRSSLKLGTVANITNVHVKDVGGLKYPGGLAKNRVQVNPDPVAKWSIDVSGRWDNFTVVWAPVNNTNFGKVLYEVGVGNVLSRITEHPNITIENGGGSFLPYSELDIVITSLTYWSSAKGTTARRRVPPAPPSQPLNLRAYLSPGLGFPYTNSTNSTLELRWDAPSSPNGLILGYLVTCWRSGVKLGNCHCDLDPSSLSCILRSPRNPTHFGVQAYNSAGAGGVSARVEGYQSSPPPRLLLTYADKIEVLDVDRGERSGISLGYVAPLSTAFLGSENTIFWFNEGQDLMMAKMDGSPGYNKSRILSLSGLWETSHLTMDWIGRRLYWAVEGVIQGPGSKVTYGIMTFDFAELEGDWTRASKHFEPVMVVSSKTPIRSLTFSPYRNALYWTTSKGPGYHSLYTAEARDNFTARLFLSRLTPVTSDPNPTPFCNCSHLVVGGDPITFDPSPAQPHLLFFGVGGTLWASDMEGCTCHLLLNSTGDLPQSVGSSGGHIYSSSGSGALSVTSSNSTYPLQLITSGVRALTPFGPFAQPFPPKDCLLPRIMSPETPLLFNHSSHSLHLDLPLGLLVNCSLSSDLSLPTPLYSVYYGTVDDALISKCTPSSPSHCKVVTTSAKSLHLTDLHPYTTYTVFVTLTTPYATRAGAPPLVCSPIMLRTAPGAPMPPQLLSVDPLTPVSIRVSWSKPRKLNGEKVWYEVHWDRGNSSSSAKWAETEAFRSSAVTMTTDLGELVPFTSYSVWVRAFSEKGDAFKDSVKRVVSTFPTPRNVSLISSSPHEMVLGWTPPEDNSIIMHQLLFKEAASLTWTETRMVNFTIPSRPYNWTLRALKPKTLYVVRLRAWFSGDPSAPYIHPLKGPFHFETKADKPSPPPSPPIARGIGKALYEVEWKEADENGAVIEFYSLEARLVYAHEDSDESPGTLAALKMTSPGSLSATTPSDLSGVARKAIRKKRATNLTLGAGLPSVKWGIGYEWNQVYSGKDTRWVVDGLDPRNSYNFRVRAKNSYGWGSYSNESGIVSLSELTLVAESPHSVGVIIGIILLSSFVLGLFGLLFILLYRRRLSEKPPLGSPLSSGERREVELATLRELPGGSSFIHQSNLLYGGGRGHGGGDLLLDLDLAGVPKVNWHQIIVTKFLGNGAFGEVFEGIAMNLRGQGDPEIRVAIKALRKGANSVEKQEFIQEAKLMAQFRHPHIIQLMGLCVDTDPCYLLLELMGEGDLLSYLRSNRPGQSQGQVTPETTPPPNLNLADLMRMCVDVAKGCVYLEDQHFVHRDIAARNCLVSLIPGEGGRSMRLVKIGDFGLARDIYRNDYYRKNGEGLLPVRWMAPESLVDGIFTTQTDVWAFGVLLWEIMTLGQQPYPARSNGDVLNYVRNGGTLQRPPHCPHILGNLMLQAWEYTPENRPSFKDCLSQLELILEDFHLSSGGVAFPPLHDIHFDPYSYSDGGAGGQEQGHHRHDSDSVFLPPSPTEVHHGPSTQYHSWTVPGQGQPSYLQVLGDEESQSGQASLSLSDAGYEIPLPKRPPRQPVSHSDPSTAEFGLPSPPPSYWNAETLPLSRHRGVAAQVPASASSQYRNLLASTTSEDGELEEDRSDGQNCPIPGHHYVSNMGGVTVRTHLRGLSCPYERPIANMTATLFNNHTYAAQHLGRRGSGGGGSSGASLLHFPAHHHNRPPPTTHSAA